MTSHRIEKGEKERLIKEMANYIIEQGDNCTRDVMLLQFSQAEVDACFAAAREEARRILEHRNAA